MIGSVTGLQPPFQAANGLEQTGEGVIPCFETDGESMDVYIACE